MYVPAHNAESRRDVLHGLIRDHPLGLLIVNGSEGPVANPIPFLLREDGGPNGTLACHLARANPQWKQLADGEPALVVFQGPQAYVTPSWYATKKETGKVVPTWNCCIAQARGIAEVHDNPEWLRDHVAALTDRHEAGRAKPWAVSDAPERYFETMLRGIVGFEIEIVDLTGKWKVSQNRPPADRAGVAAGYEAEGKDDMAALVKSFG